MESPKSHVPDDEFNPGDAPLEQSVLSEGSSERRSRYDNFQYSQFALFLSVERCMAGDYESSREIVDTISQCKDSATRDYAKFVLSWDEAGQVTAASELMHAAMTQLGLFVGNFETRLSARPAPPAGSLELELSQWLTEAGGTEDRHDLFRQALGDVYDSNLSSLLGYASGPKNSQPTTGQPNAPLTPGEILREDELIEYSESLSAYQAFERSQSELYSAIDSFIITKSKSPTTAIDSIRSSLRDLADNYAKFVFSSDKTERCDAQDQLLNRSIIEVGEFVDKFKSKAGPYTPGIDAMNSIIDEELSRAAEIDNANTTLEQAQASMYLERISELV